MSCQSISEVSLKCKCGFAMKTMIFKAYMIRKKRPLTVKLEKEIIKEIANNGPHERKSVELSCDCTRNTFLVQFKNNKSFILGSIFPATSVARTGGQFFSFFSTRLCFSWWYTVCTQYVHQQVIFEWGRCSY